MSSLVQAHAACFTEPDGTLTAESSRRAHAAVGIVDGVDTKFRVLRNLAHGHRCPMTAAGFSQIVNPASTGIWRSDGTFDPDRFDELAKRAVLDKNGVLCVTDAIYQSMARPSGTIATFLFYVVPVFWTRISSGSLSDMITYFADTETVTGERAITIDRLRTFYTQPREFFHSFNA